MALLRLEILKDAGDGINRVIGSSWEKALRGEICIILGNSGTPGLNES